MNRGGMWVEEEGAEGGRLDCRGCVWGGMCWAGVAPAANESEMGSLRGWGRHAGTPLSGERIRVRAG